MEPELKQKIQTIFTEVFDYNQEIALETGKSDVPNWDSVLHVNLVDSLETKFNLSLSMDEMIELQSVGDIINVLTRHGVN